MTTDELLKKNPELLIWMEKSRDRFARGTTTCDGEDCITQLTPTTFHVYLTPDNKGMLLCTRCLHKYRLKNKIFQQ